MCTRVLLLLAGVALSAGPVAAQDDETFRWRGRVARGQAVEIKGVIGPIRAELARGGDVEVVAVKRAGDEGDPDDVRIEVLEHDDGVTICALYPTPRWSMRRGRTAEPNECGPGRRGRNSSERTDVQVAFTVRVPAGVALVAKNAIGDIEIRGIRGDVEANSATGDIRLTDVRGRVAEAKTASGDVEFEDVTADTVGAETASGEVTLTRVAASDVFGHSVSGDVVFEGPIRDRGRYSFNTTSGELEVTIPDDSRATVIGSTFSGSLRSDFPAEQSTPRRRGKRFEFSIGDGGTARLELDAFSGSIRLRRGT